MEISVDKIHSCPPDTVLSIRAGGLRRQAPVKPTQRFVFPNMETECRVEVLRKCGTLNVPLVEKSVTVQLTSVDGPIHVELGMLSSIEAKAREPAPEKDNAKAIADEGGNAKASNRHVTSIRTKAYMDDHDLQNQMETMVRQLLLVKPKNPELFLVDHLLSTVLATPEDDEEINVRNQLVKLMEEANHWREAYMQAVQKLQARDEESHELDQRTDALERQLQELQNVEFQLRASSDYGVRVVHENQELLAEIEHLKAALAAKEEGAPPADSEAAAPVADAATAEVEPVEEKAEASPVDEKAAEAAPVEEKAAEVAPVDAEAAEESKRPHLAHAVSMELENEAAHATKKEKAADVAPVEEEAAEAAPVEEKADEAAADEAAKAPEVAVEEIAAEATEPTEEEAAEAATKMQAKVRQKQASKQVAQMREQRDAAEAAPVEEKAAEAAPVEEKAAEAAPIEATEAAIRASFAAIDVNQNGVISLDEWIAYQKKVTEAAVAEPADKKVESAKAAKASVEEKTTEAAPVGEKPGGLIQRLSNLAEERNRRHTANLAMRAGPAEEGGRSRASSAGSVSPSRPRSNSGSPSRPQSISGNLLPSLHGKPSPMGTLLTQPSPMSSLLTQK
jgi:hypothetical protein